VPGSVTGHSSEALHPRRARRRAGAQAEHLGCAAPRMQRWHLRKKPPEPARLPREYRAERLAASHFLMALVGPKQFSRAPAHCPSTLHAIVLSLRPLTRIRASQVLLLPARA